MSTNLEYRARENRRQASEAQREKGRQRSRASEIKKETFFGRTTWKYCIGSDKMRNASGHQSKTLMFDFSSLPYTQYSWIPYTCYTTGTPSSRVRTVVAWSGYRTRNIHKNYRALLLDVNLFCVAGVKVNLFCTNRTIGIALYPAALLLGVKANLFCVVCL